MTRERAIELGARRLHQSVCRTLRIRPTDKRSHGQQWYDRWEETSEHLKEKYRREAAELYDHWKEEGVIP